MQPNSTPIRVHFYLTPSKNQSFKGIWRNKPENPDEDLLIILTLETRGDAVSGRISFSEDNEEYYTLDHIHLIGNYLGFTFETDGKRNKFLEIKGSINGDEMKVTLLSNEDNYGSDLLLRED